MLAWGAAHEPDNKAADGQNCLERLGSRDNRFYWNDQQCSKTDRMSACEYELPKDSGELRELLRALHTLRRDYTLLLSNFVLDITFKRIH